MQGEEWEERWGEQYWSLGRANKFADKWGKEGNNVWHERWGEDYDGDGGCVKYTDKARPLNLPCQYIHALYFLMSGLLRPLNCNHTLLIAMTAQSLLSEACLPCCTRHAFPVHLWWYCT